MVTTGKILEKFYDRDNTLIYKVEVYIFKNPGTNGSPLNNNVLEATCSTLPGVYEPYDIGDLVYVSFVNNDVSLPVVIGKIHKGIPSKGNSYAHLKSLEVENNVILPSNTKIGSLNVNQLNAMSLSLSNLSSKVDNLFQKESESLKLYQITLTDSSFNRYNIISSSDSITYNSSDMAYDLGNHQILSCSYYANLLGKTYSAIAVDLGDGHGMGSVHISGMICFLDGLSASRVDLPSQDVTISIKPYAQN